MRRPVLLEVVPGMGALSEGECVRVHVRVCTHGPIWFRQVSNYRLPEFVFYPIESSQQSNTLK